MYIVPIPMLPPPPFPPPAMKVTERPEAAMIAELDAAFSTVASVLSASEAVECSLSGAGDRLASGIAALSAASDAVAPLQSQGIASKALHARINRAVTPALALLRDLAAAESCQRRLARLLDEDQPRGRRTDRVVACLDLVAKLGFAVGAVTEEWEAAIQRLQEAVEFISRTKAADEEMAQRLRETVAVIRTLLEAELEAMQYEGPLDQALLQLQDDYEVILLKIRHPGFAAAGDGDDQAPEEAEAGSEPNDLGSESDIEVLRRISETLAANDSLDACINIYVKARYRRAAKALMRLNPEYLKKYEPDDIDNMEWESLESAITLWIQHFKLAVRSVFVSERQLCSSVLSTIMGGTMWPECLAKIADRIMAVFFRFAEGVAHSSQEPQKLFKLLDMLVSLDGLRPEFILIFDGSEAGEDICIRFRELQKLLVHAASKVFMELGIQIEAEAEGQQKDDGTSNNTVPKIVRYAVNYLKFFASEGYGPAMGRVLQTEQIWKGGSMSLIESEENLLRDAISSILDALQRNIESKRSRYKDKVIPHLFAMNSYWYMYMRIKGSELARLVGEETIKKKFKSATEEAAYSYQSQAWGSLVELLDKGPLVELLQRDDAAAAEQGMEAITVRSRVEAFLRGFNENVKKHRNSSYSILDPDLREQIKESVTKLIVTAYSNFIDANSLYFQGRQFLEPDSVGGLLMQVFGSDSISTGGDGRRRNSVEVGNNGGGVVADWRRRLQGEAGNTGSNMGGEGRRFSVEEGRAGGGSNMGIDGRRFSVDGGRLGGNVRRELRNRRGGSDGKV